MQLFGAWSAGADVLSGRRGEDDADADADEMLSSLYVLPGRLRTDGRRSPPPNTTAVVGRRLPALLDAE